ncbi:ExbD/TolR family protein [Poritiphilus flavus]|uniref:Biopolymer transporter ExbD n=1 Tax=Poritiphilus flavus TaxID=2697053 RepID=A0A6L9E7G4_9FLAO|nr:biopolymer transporter ExbD [Poritiphilus flavus]NAS10399.1 biopolymer transporter ExbD [Poritiphilus flavus]
MARRRQTPTVQSGSVADIAFLLLIFFLVTTIIETEEGLDRLLPRKEAQTPEVPINDRNILEISINNQNELLVDEVRIGLEDLRLTTIAFLDNGGVSKGENGHCSYCQGLRSPESSDNPQEAVISLNTGRESSYGVYIAVQNELVAAYNALRDREALKTFGESYTAMSSEYRNPQTPQERREFLRARIDQIQDLFPMKLIEANTK